MSYQIVYGAEPGKRKKKLHFGTGCVWLSLLLGILFGLRFVGQEVLVLNNLLPGDAEVTASAIEALLARLESGEGLLEAVDVFCRTVVNGAKIG